jgi:hypothetical protein
VNVFVTAPAVPTPPRTNNIEMDRVFDIFHLQWRLTPPET